MRAFPDFVTALLDHDDGSCRDMNFEQPTWAGVDDLLESLRTSLKKCSGTDSDGNEIIGLNLESLSAAIGKRGMAHLLFHDSSSLIKQLQVFVCREDDGSPFVEFTFFPEDVERTENLKRDFLTWADGVQALLKSRRYFVRYENVSWNLGDTGETSGVIWVSEPNAPDR